MAMHNGNLNSAPNLRGRLAMWLATGVGVGLVAPAPGTIGGLWGVPLAAWASHLAPPAVQVAVLAVLAVIAALVADAAQRVLAAGDDPQSIVIDEIVALPIVFVGVGPVNWKLLAAGFLLFRICDISKPGLARSAEKLPGGWGIVADDLVAAALACVMLHVAIAVDAWAGWNWLMSGRR